MGDCAARGADLFESIAAEIISAMILGGTMAERCKIEGKLFVVTVSKVNLNSRRIKIGKIRTVWFLPLKSIIFR